MGAPTYLNYEIALLAQRGRVNGPLNRLRRLRLMVRVKVSARGVVVSMLTRWFRGKLARSECSCLRSEVRPGSVGVV